MEYREKHPSFKQNYHKGPTNVTGLDGYCNADWDLASDEQFFPPQFFNFFLSKTFFHSLSPLTF